MTVHRLDPVTRVSTGIRRRPWHRPTGQPARCARHAGNGQTTHRLRVPFRKCWRYRFVAVWNRVRLSAVRCSSGTAVEKSSDVTQPS